MGQVMVLYRCFPPSQRGTVPQFPSLASPLPYGDLHLPGRHGLVRQRKGRGRGKTSSQEKIRAVRLSSALEKNHGASCEKQAGRRKEPGKMLSEKGVLSWGGSKSGEGDVRGTKSRRGAW